MLRDVQQSGKWLTFHIHMADVNENENPQHVRTFSCRRRQVFLKDCADVHTRDLEGRRFHAYSNPITHFSNQLHNTDLTTYMSIRRKMLSRQTYPKGYLRIHREYYKSLTSAKAAAYLKIDLKKRFALSVKPHLVMLPDILHHVPWTMQVRCKGRALCVVLIILESDA